MSNQEDRVLSRRGAREVTNEEAMRATAGYRPTITMCTFDGRVGTPDGDQLFGEINTCNEATP